MLSEITNFEFPKISSLTNISSEKKKKGQTFATFHLQERQFCTSQIAVAASEKDFS